MRAAAHDLGDRAAVHAEVVRSPALTPAEHENGVEYVAGGKVIAGELSSHKASSAEAVVRDATGLKISP